MITAIDLIDIKAYSNKQLSKHTEVGKQPLWELVLVM